MRWVKKVSFWHDGKTLATGGEDGVRLLEVATGQPIHALQGHKGWIRAVAFSSDGKTLTTAGEDNTVRLWEAATGKPIRTLQGQGGRFWSAAFSPDGKTLATRGGDGSTSLWEVTTGRKIRTSRVHTQSSLWWQITQVFAVAFSPDGKTVTTGERGKMRLWATATGKPIRTLLDNPPGHRKANIEEILAVTFSPDGKTVASGDQCGTVCLREVATGKLIRTLQSDKGRVVAVAFSPDGRIVATGVQTGGPVRLWEMATGKLIRTLQGHKEEIFSLVFSPDGKTLAVASGDQVRLWDLLRGDELPPLAGHCGPVLGLTFSPDGMTLASVSGDNTGLIWKLTSRNARPATKRDQDALGALWTDLASPDAARAWRAVWALAAAPAQSVPLLRARLRPVPAEMEKQLARLIADLDADEFKVRQKAYRELEEWGLDAEPALRRGLEGRPSVELRKRLKQLLEAEQNWRGLRAVAALELASTPEARQMLKTLASGAPGFRLTQEAQASLHRLDRVKQP